MNLSAYWDKLVRLCTGGHTSAQSSKAKDPKEKSLNDPQQEEQRTLFMAGWLTLQFTSAADIPAFDTLFEPDIKEHIDPKGNIAKRQSKYYEEAIADGHAVYIKGEEQAAYSIGMAYHTSLDGDLDKRPADYIEIGTMLSVLSRFNMSALTGSALTLKEWLNGPPVVGFASAIKSNNVGSILSFTRMGWIPEDNEDFYNPIIQSCDQNLVPNSNNKVPGPDDPPEDWYVLGPDALAAQAKILLEFLDRGTLYNKKTDEHIQIDLRDLDRVGLTRERLEAIALGETDRDVLLAMNSDQASDQTTPPTQQRRPKL